MLVSQTSILIFLIYGVNGKTRFLFLDAIKQLHSFTDKIEIKIKAKNTIPGYIRIEKSPFSSHLMSKGTFTNEFELFQTKTFLYPSCFL